MLIKEIQLQNFKSTTETYHLSPVNIVTGPNGSGKTAIALGLRLGLTGYLPVLGKTAQELYKLAGNPDQPGEMCITLLTDPAGVIQHRWTRNAKGAVSYAGALPPDLAWPEAMLDFRRFLSLPAAEQASEIFSRCESKVEPGDFMAKLDMITGVRPEVVHAAVEEIKTNLLHPACGRQLGPWIETSLGWLKKRASEEGAVEKRMGSALQLHVKNQPARAEDVSAKLTAAQAELNEALEQTARHTNAWRRYERDLATHKAVEENWKHEKERVARDFEAAYMAAKDKLNEVDRMTECPTCGGHGHDWKAKWMASISDTVLALESQFKRDVAEIQGRKPADKPKPPEETPKALQVRIAELQATVNDLSNKQRYHEGTLAWRKRRDELEIEAGIATCRVAVFKEAVKMLGAWRDEQINGGIGTVLAVANKFWSLTGLAQIEWNKDRGEFGRNNPGWISLDTFSGFEEQLAFAALSVAVASTARVKLVIMDEMGRMTPKNKVSVVQRMAELVIQGVIDQFIGIDVSPNDYRAFEGSPVRFIEL